MGQVRHRAWSLEMLDEYGRLTIGGYHTIAHLLRASGVLLDGIVLNLRRGA